MNWQCDQGGGGAIDLVMHLAGLDAGAAVRWLEQQLGTSQLSVGKSAAGTLGLITGASGLGKSALLKRLWHELRGPSAQVHYLHLAQLSSNDLLRLLVRTLGETPLWSKDQLLGQPSASRSDH